MNIKVTYYTADHYLVSEDFRWVTYDLSHTARVLKILDKDGRRLLKAFSIYNILSWEVKD